MAFCPFVVTEAVSSKQYFKQFRSDVAYLIVAKRYQSTFLSWKDVTSVEVFSTNTVGW